MLATLAQTGRFHHPALRRVMVVLCTLVYLVAGALHGACDIDVTKPAPQGIRDGIAVISAVSDVGHNTADKALIADHHCHGCFSVSIADPATTLAPVAFAGPIPVVAQPDQVGAAPMLETPPPKHLT
ncbi:hypothetical protein [Bradyrhizobium prioriisuperbiae]|uniref:hypothetical protein n=1 Tax=Bradyrhizobium prioriisuperbiae TaxID=2854389 RepID=UPI0028EC0582|nr:hypothetical protein [Bradyrhizobium prioritasuperba]